MINKFNRIVVVGCGGIGGWLVPPLCRFLHFAHKEGGEKTEIVLIDGDKVEERNFTRQNFNGLGYKAELLRDQVAHFTNLRISTVMEYVTKANINRHVRENDLVFMGVDNNASRKLFSERFEDLADAVMICGGNEFDDGSVQLYIRKDGENFTKSLVESSPSIGDPKDKNPGEAGCEELAVAGAPQLIFTNWRVAALMGEVFYNVYYTEKPFFPDIVYCSIKGLAQRAVSSKSMEEL
ncbi:ThiF family adenylyltransferase [bacterium]|nr:MAG: ThiF family adenylyltransferase [bacterium]